MSRKSIVLGLAILLVVTGSVGAALVLVLRHQRNFYTRAAPPPGPERERESVEFFAKFCALVNGMIVKDSEWEERFTERQINSYFVEDFIRSGISKEVLPEGISEPRIAIEGDRIRLGFRYGEDPWSTIISIDFRVWLVAQEPNAVALEFQAVHAGGLPISAQSLLERVFEVARRQNVQVNWYNYNGNPVALLRFQSNSEQPSVRLERLELHDGVIVIGGRSSDQGRGERQALQSMMLPRTALLAPTAD